MLTNWSSIAVRLRGLRLTGKYHVYHLYVSNKWLEVKDVTLYVENTRQIAHTVKSYLWRSVFWA